MLALLALAICGVAAHARQIELAGDPELRATLSALVAEGRTDEAVQRAQDELRKRPDDAAVRHEYVILHMSLARHWLRRREFGDCQTALKAVIAAEPAHAGANRMLAEIRAARRRAEGQTREIDRLLKLELFEAALDRVQQVKALRPNAESALDGRERSAWLGAADDHYLARNFNESLALYEKLFALDPKLPNDARRRWGISLALTIAESGDKRLGDPELSRRILSRVADVLGPLAQPAIERFIRGLLADKAGQGVEAGRYLAAALGEVWELPDADRRRAVVSNLRQRSLNQLRKLYQSTPTHRRTGVWSIALPNVWKNRRTPHFDVYARSDLVSEYVADALEYHFNGIAKWLNVEPAADWTLPCEVRVYADLDEFHEATDTSGVTRAVSRTRVQGPRILSRTISVFQSDPWLLSSTLPHELTHILLTEKLRDDRDSVIPRFVLDEGLAVHAEPAARRLQYRRLLTSQTPNPLNLMKIGQIIGDQASFYARCGSLVEFVLQRKGMPGLLEVCRRADSSWWQALDWPNKDAMLAEWKPWYAARRDPPRMPLMILTAPDQGNAGGK